MVCGYRGLSPANGKRDVFHYKVRNLSVRRREAFHGYCTIFRPNATGTSFSCDFTSDSVDAAKSGSLEIAPRGVSNIFHSLMKFC
jgi:hypothetical protein